MSNSYDSSDEHRAVKKNGHDQAQDRELREMRKMFIDFIERNDATHMQLIGDMKEINASLKADRRLGNTVWSFIGIIAIMLSSLFAWQTARINEFEDQLSAIDARTQVDWQSGKKWGEKLDADVARMERRLDIMREQLDRLRSQRSQGR